MGQRRSPLGVVELELLAARGWPGLVQEHLGGWLLRAGEGFTGRANSALVAGDPGLPLDEAVAAVGRWYDERELTPRAQLPGVQSRAADAAFAAAGWAREEDVLVLTAPLVADGPTAADVPVDLSPEPDDAWLAGYEHPGGTLPPAARAVLTAGEGLVFASVRLEPAPAPLAAVARGAVSEDWLGITALTVAEHHRRRGLATAVTTALQRDAAGRGATQVYLQVTAGNTAARELYRRLGFIEHHRYHYRHRAG